MDTFEAIKFNYIFRGLEENQLLAIEAIVDTRSYEGGDTIVRQFDRDYDLMIVAEGEARISSFSGETIATVGPGSLIGEMALIDDQPRSATVTAVGKTKVVVLPYESLKNVLAKDSDIAAKVVLNIAKVLTQRLRTTNMQLDAALTQKTKGGA